MTVAHITTVAFVGIDAREVDVQVHMSEQQNNNGKDTMAIVGLEPLALIGWQPLRSKSLVLGKFSGSEQGCFVLGVLQVAAWLLSKRCHPRFNASTLQRR